MALSSYAEDLIELSLDKICRANSLLKIVLIKSLVETASTEDLTDDDIIQMLDMETSVGDLLQSLRQPHPRRRKKRRVPTGPKPVSPLTIPQTPCVGRSRTEEPEAKRRRISKGLSVVAALKAEMEAEHGSDSDLMQ